jgi:branched-chain amino acid transport system ATP-binding protein
MSRLEIRGLAAVDMGIRLSVDVGSMRIEEGIHVLCGPNGGGKSLLLRALAGLVEHQGWVSLDGRPLQRANAAGRARRGLVLVSPKLGNFGALTVEENLLLALRSERFDAPKRLLDVLVYAWLPRLYSRRREPAALLGRDDQGLLALGRGLAGRPRVLLLDELSYGLTRPRRAVLTQLLSRLCTSLQLPMLISENDFGHALRMGDFVWALEAGRVIASGRPPAIVPPDPPQGPEPRSAALALPRAAPLRIDARPECKRALRNAS